MPLPRRSRPDGHGPGKQFGEESLEPPSAIRRELGPDRRQGVWRRGQVRGGTQIGSSVSMNRLRGRLVGQAMRPARAGPLRRW